MGRFDIVCLVHHLRCPRFLHLARLDLNGACYGRACYRDPHVLTTNEKEKTIMAIYKSRKVGEIHKIEKEKTDWGAIFGGLFILFIVLALIGAGS